MLIQAYTHHLAGRPLTSGWWEVAAIKDMRVVNGKREWLVAWAGKDDRGRPWTPSWRPSCHVRPQLRTEFMHEIKTAVPKRIEVDVRPLDSLVQRSIAQAAMKELSASFGRVHVLDIAALQLRELAVYYFNSVVDRYGLTPKNVYDPRGNVLTVELQIKNPDDVGDFCSFEHFMTKNTGIGALRYALGRASNTDAMVISPINMFYSDNRHTPGCVSFSVEFSTYKINGDTGNLTPPHLANNSPNPLKMQAYKNNVIMYARAMMPRSHSLIKDHHWDELPAHVWTVP